MILYRGNRLPITIPDWRAARKELKLGSLLQAGTRLCESCPEQQQLIGVLADAVVENAIITKEMRNRLVNKPFAKDLFLLDQGRKNDVGTLQKLLQVDRITSYRPSKYDDKDIRQDTWANTFQVYRKQGHAALRQYEKQIKSISSPPLGLHPLEEEFWNNVVQPAWFNNMKRYVEKVLPILDPPTEKILEQTRLARRSHFEKWKAKKREGKDVPLRAADRVNLTRSKTGVWQTRGVRIDPAASRDPDVTAQMSAVLREAKKHKRWGDKVVKAIKFRLEGKTEEEAAKLAGITDKTFRNCITRLNKIFASQK